jgi:uncharacterized damage-inducible protein DinB
MITTATTIEQLNEATTAMAGMAASVPQSSFNTIPFEGSWTVGQLLQHMIKSDRSTLDALNGDTIPTTRNGDELVEKLRDIFLSTDNKFDAPAFIVPEEQQYDKETMLRLFIEGRDEIIQVLRETDMLETCTTHPVLKDYTRLELVWFIVFHTMRHSRQLERIIAQL